MKRQILSSCSFFPRKCDRYHTFSHASSPATFSCTCFPLFLHEEDAHFSSTTNLVIHLFCRSVTECRMMLMEAYPHATTTEEEEEESDHFGCQKDRRLHPSGRRSGIASSSSFQSQEQTVCKMDRSVQHDDVKREKRKPTFSSSYHASVHLVFIMGFLLLVNCISGNINGNWRQTSLSASLLSHFLFLPLAISLFSFE